MIDITISNIISINKNDLSKEILDKIHRDLNIINPDYLNRKKLGKSVYGIIRYFKLYKETKDNYVFPRGYLGQFVKFCKENKYSINIIDNRPILKKIGINSSITLFPFQKVLVDKTTIKDFGVLVAPPGAGKTVMALEIIFKKKVNSLIIVHRKQLMDQWIERIEKFLNIPKREIGQVSGIKKKIGKKITVAMIQSLSKMKIDKNEFGIIIVDECHHIPAKVFRKTIIKFNSKYIYGFTATPIRKNKDEKLIFLYIGEIIAQINNIENKIVRNKIIIKKTNLYMPFDFKKDDLQLMSKVLIADTERNKLIVDDIKKQAEKKKNILVLSERKDHVALLELYLKSFYELIIITGDDSLKSREKKIKKIEKGNFKIIISTGQFFGEGLDVKYIDCLFLVYPFSFEGKLIQYIGRIQRSDGEKLIFDYYDYLIEFYKIQFNSRFKVYKKNQFEICNL